MTRKQRSIVGWGTISRVAYLTVALATSKVAWAQAPEGDCFPPCRQGYLCHAGQCILACNPACGAGQVCTSQGQCVSACNPPCAANEVCIAAGQCVQQGPAVAPTPIDPAVVTPVAPGSSPQVAAPAPQLGMQTNAPASAMSPMAGNSAEMYDTGWAGGASIFGYVSASATLALTAAVIATNDSSNGDTPRNLGIAATTLVMASGPIVAIGGASARNHPSVKGAPALRVVSWIGYGLTIADAGLLIALSFDNKIDNGQILSVGLLGTLSTLGFAIDAGASARQTAALQPARVSGARFDFSPIPRLGLAVTGPGQRVPMLNWSGRF